MNVIIFTEIYTSRKAEMTFHCFLNVLRMKKYVNPFVFFTKALCDERCSENWKVQFGLHVK